MSKQILIIDDEDLIIKSLSKLLTKSGYDVSTANTGMVALELIDNNDFNLIISDIRMPWVNGIDTIKEITNTLKADNRPLPAIIFITGFADKNLETAAKDFTPAAYLHKPIDIKDFLKVVQKSLSYSNQH